MNNLHGTPDIASKHQRDQGSQPSDHSITFRKLNPLATEFVPSQRLSSEYDGFATSEGEFGTMQQALDAPMPEKKTEATSTTTLTHRDMISSMKSQSELVYKKQRELLNLLRQLGTTSHPMIDIRVCLAPNGSRINVEFSGPSVEQTVDASSAWACEAAALYMDVKNAKDLAERPSNLLVAQFLKRMSDALSEQIHSSQEYMRTKCAAQSYTEEEIERQIEGIKKFENFLTSKEGSQIDEIVKHTAYKELCNNLGIPIASGSNKFSPFAELDDNGVIGNKPTEYMQNSYAANSTAISPRQINNTQQTIECTSDEEVESMLEEYGAAEYTSSSSLCSGQKKIYKYASPDGVDLHVNRLSDVESENLYVCNKHNCQWQDVPNSTPVISKMCLNRVSEQARYALAKVAAVAKDKPAQQLVERPGNGSECRCSVHKCARKKHCSNLGGSRAGAKKSTEYISDTLSKYYSRVAPHVTDCPHLPAKSNAAAGSRSVKATSQRTSNATSMGTANYATKSAKPGHATQRSNTAKHTGTQKIVPQGIAASIKSELKKQRLNLLKGHNFDTQYHNQYLCK